MFCDSSKNLYIQLILSIFLLRNDVVLIKYELMIFFSGKFSSFQIFPIFIEKDVVIQYVKCRIYQGFLILNLRLLM